MTAQVIRFPQRAALEAATDWLLAELNGPASLDGMRAIAERELARPRDGIHRRWAEVFLREIDTYSQSTGE